MLRIIDMAYNFWSIIGLLILIISMTNGQFSTDLCDWAGSGLTQAEKEIQPIYLRCAQGRIEWLYPTGALRAVLQLGTAGKDFKGCIRVSKQSSGASIYLEHSNSLKLLFNKRDGKHHNLVRCFNSKDGKAILYIEAEPNINDLQKHVAYFNYDLQRIIPHSHPNDYLEDCRPCTEKEILETYCTTDFVVLGEMHHVLHKEDLEETHIEIMASKIYRQNHPIFKEKKSGVKHGILTTPLKCGVKSGTGHFLFMGTMRLGTPILQCAPRIEEWQHIREKVNREGTNLCNLG